MNLNVYITLVKTDVSKNCLYCDPSSMPKAFDFHLMKNGVLCQVCVSLFGPSGRQCGAAEGRPGCEQAFPGCQR